MSTNNLSPKVRKSAKKILNLATKSRRSMQVNQMNFVRTSAFIGKEAKRISQPKIDKKKLKKLLNTDFASIASNAGGGGGGFNPLDLLGGGLGGGGGRPGRPGRKPPSRRAQQRYRRRFGNRAANRRFGRLPQFGRGGGIRVPRAGGVLGVAMAGLEYGGRLSEGQTQTQAITGTAASTAGGIAGAMGGAKGGAAIGALIGSIVPGAGTALGAAIGGLIGGIAGGMAGSSLAGGAADKLTGANKIIGKDEESEKAEKELQKKSKINPLELTLDRFDQVVNRFSEVIMSLDLSGNQLPDKSDLDAALEEYGPEKVIAVLQAQQAAAERERKLKEQQQAEARVREGFMGDALADVMFPKEEKQDATSKVLGAVGVPESMQPATAMVVEAAIEAFAMSRGRGMKRPVMTRPLTKPYSLQGPELPPVQGPTQRIPSPAETRARVVRSADTLPRPEVKPTEPLVRQPAQTVQEVLGRGRRARVKRTVDQVEKSQMRSEAELDAARDMAEGGYRRSQSTVEPQQNLIEGQTTLPDGSTVYYRKPMGRSAASRRKRLEPSKETQTDSEVKIMERDQDQLQSDILSDKVRSNQTIQDALDQAARDAERVRKIEKIFTPKTTNPLDGEKLSSINQYTTYNAPNNTTIIMQNGGQMPPQSPPPQMMASAPPPKMPPGPSTYDLASTLGTAILINKLQEC